MWKFTFQMSNGESLEIKFYHEEALFAFKIWRKALEEAGVNCRLDEIKTTAQQVSE